MKSFKRNLMLVMLVIGVLGTTTTVMAAAPINEREKLNPNAIIEREDVEIGLGTRGRTFNLQDALAQKKTIRDAAKNHWNSWGSSEDGAGSGGVRGAKPVGYSRLEDESGNTVSIYHYTRTYLGAILKRGDSGEVWGYETVKAVGTFCDYGVWEAHSQVVKYGLPK